MYIGNDFRNTHYVAPLKKDSLPWQIIGVGFAEKHIVNDIEFDGHETTVESLAYRKLTLAKDLTYRMSSSDDKIDSQMFYCLLQAAPKGKSVFVVADDMQRFLNGTQFWTHYLGTVLTLTPHDMLCDVEKAKLLKKGWSGYVANSSSPFIVKCKSTLTGAGITFVDIANYGDPELIENDGLCCKDLTWNGKSICDLSTRDKKLHLQAETVAHALRRCATLAFEFEMGTLDCTTSSQAFRAYRRTLTQERNSYLVSGASHILTLERAAYQPSVCWRFFDGMACDKKKPGWKDTLLDDPRVLDSPVYIWDINSAYPQVMRAHDLPVRPSSFFIQPDEQTLRMASINPNACIACVRMETGDRPYYAWDDEKWFLANGLIDTVLCGKEYANAMRDGKIKKVYELCSYDLDCHLSVFAERMLDACRFAKANLGSFEQCFAKRVRNGLHGKIGSKSQRWVSLPGMCSPDDYCVWYTYSIEDGRQIKFRSIAGHVEEERPTNYEEPYQHEWKHSSPAIPAFIAAAVREELFSVIRFVGKENVLYCDTDSVHLTQAGHDQMQLMHEYKSTVPGCWSLRCVASKVEYFGLKCYLADGILTAAGVPKKADIRGRIVRFLESDSPHVQCYRGAKSHHYARVKYIDLARIRCADAVGSDGRIDFPVSFPTNHQESRINIPGFDIFNADLPLDGEVSYY